MILKLSMNYYKLTIIINALLLLGISNNALSQQSSKYKLLEVPKNNQIEVDQYGYFYIIDQDNLIKYDSEGHTLYHYSNKLLGNIDQIDISNPLRPLLFYKDQGLIIVLDNYDYASIPSKSLNGWLELLQSMDKFPFPIPNKKER